MTELISSLLTQTATLAIVLLLAAAALFAALGQLVAGPGAAHP